MFRSISKLLFLIALGAACATSVWSKTITIGILDTIDPWFYVQTFGPTMEHLRKVIPQYEIKSVELSFENLQKAIKAGELDFFIAPSGFFAYVAESAGARHIATRHPQGAKDPSKSVGSVFVGTILGLILFPIWLGFPLLRRTQIPSMAGLLR